MSLVAVLFAPLMLLFPAAGAIEPMRDDPRPAPGEASGAVVADGGPGWIFREVAESFRVEAQNQVRVEQHMSIRISPLSRPPQLPRNFLLDIPQREIGPRFLERKIGRCLPVSGISGVQPNGASRLILFMRDRRMISATLDRACRARDFYSGFYVDRTEDGQLCVDRDTLLSRSGANCKLTRIRQLIDVEP
jgi:hypothetical protein